MVLSDGSTLNDPTDSEIAAAVGAPPDVETTTYDLLVVGAGPAGLSAAVYGASEGLRVLVVDAGGIGGQARSSSLIRNYLGFARGVSGARLALQAYDQAALFGAQFLFFRGASRVVASPESLSLSLEDGQSISARSMVLATGASYRRLGIPALEKLTGAGVFYGGPVAEAPTLTGTDVFVVGGGNSAGQAALHLARYARRVTLLVRAASLDSGMSHYLVREVEAAPNIEVRTGTTVSGGGGEARLDHLVLQTLATGEQTTVEADALFVLIGAHPLTDWLPAGIAKDAHGFLLTGDDLDDCLATHPAAAATGDQHPTRLRGWRHSPRLSQAGRSGGRRRRHRSAVRPPRTRSRSRDSAARILKARLAPRRSARARPHASAHARALVAANRWR